MAQDVLIIGGTRFAGRHLVDALVAGGNNVTLFNRGISDPSPREDVAHVHGDRSTGLAALGAGRWDAVVDMCGFTPAAVATAAGFFADRTKRYVFVSSVSVYDFDKTNGPGEDAPVLELPPGAGRDEMTPETYGALKALCENAVRDRFGERAAIVRPGLIAGPFDQTDRFTYWPLRIAAGGDVLAPVSSAEPIQYIDARDLAAFIALLCKAQTGGTYNAVTSPQTLTFGDLFDACFAATHAQARVTYAGADFLQAHDVSPWSDMPLWIPASDSARALTSTSNARALDAGLRTRPIPETVRDTLQWAQTCGKALGSLNAGLTPEREREVLAALASGDC